MSKPKFDPSRPYEPVAKPRFDPSQPFEPVKAQRMSGSFNLDDEPPSQVQAVPATPAQDVGPSRTEAFARGAEQGISFGFGDELNGAIQALGQKYLPESWGGAGDAARPLTFGELYRSARNAERVANANAEAKHKGYYVGGNIAGALATTPFLPGASSAKGVVGLVAQGAKVGAATGAAYGLGSSDADLTRGEYGQSAWDAAKGGLGGLALGSAVPAATAATGYAARLVGAPVMSMVRGGFVQPTPEAQSLIKEGAQLTLGQMDPNSFMGRMEELASHKATASEVANMRANAVGTARDALLRKAAAPGARPPTAGAPVRSQIEEIEKGFSDAYNEVLDGVKVQPDQYIGAGKWRGFFTDPDMKGAAKTKGAFELAVDGVKDASASTKEKALTWLADAAETNGLTPAKSGANVGTVDARSVQALRTKIRDELRDIGEKPSGEDRQLKKIYERAEGFVSELLEGQLPPANADKLRKLDGSFRNILALRKASEGAGAFKEGAGGEFTPTQLLEAIRQIGSTPELEGLTRDAHNVLSAKYRPTGIQGQALELFPGSHYAAQPLAHLFNTNPAWRQRALTPIAPGLPSQAASALGPLMERLGRSPRATPTAARTLYDVLMGPRAPSFAGTYQPDSDPLAGTR